MTQEERIIKHLDVYGSITPIEALREYGIMRLASRISSLRKKGFDIEREFVSAKNRFDENISYARYKFGGVNDER